MRELTNRKHNNGVLKHALKEIKSVRKMKEKKLTIRKEEVFFFFFDMFYDVGLLLHISLLSFLFVSAGHQWQQKIFMN